MRKLLISIIIFPIFILSQYPSLDSIALIANTEGENDSIQMKYYVSLAQEHMKYNNIDSILPISIKSIKLAAKTKESKLYAKAYNLLGYYFLKKYQYQTAINIYNLSKQYSEQNGISRDLGLIYRDLSYAHRFLGNSDSALFYAENYYKLSTNLEDKSLQFLSLGALGSYYNTLGAFPKALDYTNRLLKLAISLQDTSKIIRANISMGSLFGNLERYQELVDLNNSLLTDFDSLSLAPYIDNINLNTASAYEELGQMNKSLEYNYKVLNTDKIGLKGMAYSNIATIYLKLLKSNTPVKAILFVEKENLKRTSSNDNTIVLKLIYDYLNNSIDNFNSISATNYNVRPLINFGEYYDYLNMPKSSLKNFNEAWKIAEEYNLIKEQKEIADRLYNINKKQKNLKEALKWHEKYISIKDSLDSKKIQQEIGKQLAKIEFTSIKLKDSLEQIKKDEIQRIRFEQQNNSMKNETIKKYYLYGGLLITVSLLFILFRRISITKKQKRLIELQKCTMEKKQVELLKSHLEIRDSINYSQRIQKLIFPSDNYFHTVFPDNFIFFQPKDTVSGDFYWCCNIRNKKIIVLADCTGHGVPGAFMTIVGINILKEIVQRGGNESAEFLRHINVELKAQLGQNDQKVKDGMDIGICIIDDKTIEFSGAHFPLYHISENSFIEYKGSNLFLGSEDEMKNIKTHYIPYKKGDLIYMITDGFPDQKGGVKGKKYFYKPLRNLIHENSSLPMKMQKKALKSELRNWIALNNIEQMDDVTVIGIKL